jgi:hypothetical protein
MKLFKAVRKLVVPLGHVKPCISSVRGISHLTRSRVVHCSLFLCIFVFRSLIDSNI